MSEQKEKPQVRPEAKVQVINGLARGGHGLGGKATGLVSLYDAMPSASGLEDGVLGFNLGSGVLQITVSGAWVNVA